MLNTLWAGMLLLGILWGVFRGTLSQVTSALLESTQSAVQLCLTMAGIVSLWSGLSEVALKSGLLDEISHFLRPLLRFLFPSVPDGHPAQSAISANITANLLGLGWAATPAGLSAMQELSALQGQEKTTASDEMCDFLILNMSSLQLIPINMIAYRTQYGSVHPSAILMPALLATSCSTIAGIAAARLLRRIWP